MICILENIKLKKNNIKILDSILMLVIITAVDNYLTIIYNGEIQRQAISTQGEGYSP